MGQLVGTRRSGLVVMPELLRPMGGGTPIRGQVVTPPRPRLRRGIALLPRPTTERDPIAAAGEYRAVLAPHRHRPGVVIRHRRLALGDLHRWAGPPMRPAALLARRRGGMVIRPRMLPDAPEAAAQALIRAVAMARHRLGAGLVVTHRLPALADELAAALVRPPAVRPGAQTRRAGLVIQHRHGITPAGTLPPPLARTYSRVVPRRGGLVVRIPWPVSDAAWRAASLPDPWAATSA